MDRINLDFLNKREQTFQSRYSQYLHKNLKREGRTARRRFFRGIQT